MLVGKCCHTADTVEGLLRPHTSPLTRVLTRYSKAILRIVRRVLEKIHLRGGKKLPWDDGYIAPAIVSIEDEAEYIGLPAL